MPALLKKSLRQAVPALVALCAVSAMTPIPVQADSAVQLSDAEIRSLIEGKTVTVAWYSSKRETSTYYHSGKSFTVLLDGIGQRDSYVIQNNMLCNVTCFSFLRDPQGRVFGFYNGRASYVVMQTKPGDPQNLTERSDSKETRAAHAEAQRSLDWVVQGLKEGIEDDNRAAAECSREGGEYRLHVCYRRRY